MPFKDKEKRAEYDKQYRIKNKEKTLEKYKKYYYKNKEKIAQLRKSRYDSEKEAKRKNSIRENNKRLLIELGLLTDCVICGFPKELFVAIDFHHLNPSEKQYSISDLIKKNNQSILLNEAKKCVCLCRNCHALYHGGNAEIIKQLHKTLSGND